MATISEALALALQQHRAGQFETAEKIYRRILAAEPRHADSLHFLGVIAHQQGRQEEALDLIRQAIALSGEVAPYHHNLGNVWHALGKYAEAESAGRQALALEPESAEARLSLALALRELGKVEEAVATLREALARRPDFPEAHHNLGHMLAEQGQPAEAEEHLRRALALHPDYAEAHYTLGKVLRAGKELEAAAAAFRRALELRPDFTDARNVLTHVLFDLGRNDEALHCYEEAVRRQPGSPEPHHIFGVIHLDRDEFAEAEVYFQRALEIDPRYAETYKCLGYGHWMQGRLEEAIALSREALALDPGLHEARRNLAMYLLVLGRHEEGWPHYEARLPMFPPRAFTVPRWDGEPAEGQTLFLSCEQGFGDALQFVRYAPLVRERARAGKVIVECYPELLRLLRYSFSGELEFVSCKDPDALAELEFHAHLPLLSAPVALKRYEPAPMQGAYLRVEPESLEKWQARLAGPKALRVGFAWKGNPQHDRDRFRSMALDLFQPLFALPGVRWYSLQMGRHPAEAAALEAAGAADLAPEITDFTDTAAVVAELDLVISVDTSLAHLAGALARPVWTLLPTVPDWRWELEGESTAWYPTMRLFRQKSLGDWPGVLSEVAARLA